MRKALALTAALVVAGCGDDASSGPAASTPATNKKSTPGAAEGPCAERVGSYLAHYEEQANGDCGAIADSIAVFKGSQLTMGGTCTGPQDVSKDGCAITSDITCDAPELGKGYKTRLSGTVRWSEDGTAGAGTVSLLLLKPDGTADCQSVYKSTYTLQ